MGESVDFPEERFTLSDEALDALLAAHLQTMARREPPERFVFVATEA